MGLSGLASGLLGCSVCFGNPDSPLVKGAEAGVLVLAGIISLVLVAIAGIAVYWTRRAKMLEASEEFDRKPVMPL